jgi:glycosyltransferase involved in cell wall biosynthesis
VRIALIAPPWLPVPPPAYGGTEAVIDRLARGYAAAGADVFLFTTGDSTCPVPKTWVYSRAETEQIGAGVVELRHVIHAYDAVRDCDVVHDHTVVGPLYAHGKRDQLIVTTNHGPFDDELTDIYRDMADRVHIIAISHSQAATAGDVPIAKVIHHGVDPEAFPVGAGEGGYLLFLGRMTPTKGAREAALVALQAGVPLVIAAKMREPLEREYYQSQVRPLLRTGVEYVGEASHAEKLALLGGATTLVNPIAWPEPFGLVMVEAMACGTPVLAFPCGAAPEIVRHGETGFLCRDVDDMVDHLDRVPELDRARCRAAVEDHFSTGRMVAEHLELFEQLLG